MTVWPSGLRRWLKAPVRKGVGSNPTAVTHVLCSWCKGGSSILSCARVLAALLASLLRCLLQLGRGAFERLVSPMRLILTDHQDSLAEWSKALAPGASPKGRGFEPHSCHCSDVSTGSPVGRPVGVSRTLGGSRARRFSLARTR